MPFQPAADKPRRLPGLVLLLREAARERLEAARSRWAGGIECHRGAPIPALHCLRWEMGRGGSAQESATREGTNLD